MHRQIGRVRASGARGRLLKLYGRRTVAAAERAATQISGRRETRGVDNRMLVGHFIRTASRTLGVGAARKRSHATARVASLPFCSLSQPVPPLRLTAPQPQPIVTHAATTSPPPLYTGPHILTRCPCACLGVHAERWAVCSAPCQDGGTASTASAELNQSADPASPLGRACQGDRQCPVRILSTVEPLEQATGRALRRGRGRQPPPRRRPRRRRGAPRRREFRSRRCPRRRAAAWRAPCAASS